MNSLLALRNKLDKLKSEERQREESQNCSSLLRNEELSGYQTCEITDHSAWISRIRAQGNSAGDWLQYIQYVKNHVTFEDTGARNVYLSAIFDQANQAICDQENKTETYGKLLIAEAQLKGETCTDDGRVFFNRARLLAKKFSVVHIAAAQFELDNGNCAKARKILEKGKEWGAQPHCYLMTAFRNLLEKKSVLLSESDKENVKESILDDQSHEHTDLLKPKKSWISPRKEVQPMTSSFLAAASTNPSQSLATSCSQSQSEARTTQTTRDIPVNLQGAHRHVYDNVVGTIAHTSGSTSLLSSQQRAGKDLDTTLSREYTAQPNFREQTADSHCQNQTNLKFSHVIGNARRKYHSGSSDDGEISAGPLHPESKVTPSSSLRESRPGQSDVLSTAPHGTLSSNQSRPDPLSHAQPESHTADHGNVPNTQSLLSSHSKPSLRTFHSTPDCKSAGVFSSTYSSRRRPPPLSLGKPQRVLRTAVPKLGEEMENMDDDHDNVANQITEGKPADKVQQIINPFQEQKSEAENSPTSDSGVLTQSSMDFSQSHHDGTSSPSMIRCMDVSSATPAPPLTPMDCSQVLSPLPEEPMDVDYATQRKGVQSRVTETVEHQASQAVFCDKSPSTHQRSLSSSFTKQPSGANSLENSYSRTSSTLCAAGGPAAQAAHTGQSSGIPAQGSSLKQQAHSASFKAPVSSSEKSHTAGAHTVSGIIHHKVSEVPSMQQLPAANIAAGAPCIQQLPVMNTETLVVSGNLYFILKVIGKGGFSEVYEACDSNKNLRAIKCVNLKDANEAMVTGLHNEITLLQRLQYSDKVIKIYDYEHNAEKDALYVVMERGDTDLASLFHSHCKCGGGGISANTRRFYWEEMLKAVQVLHKEGIVHSDLKPANFLLVAGNLKLIDFGIANAIAQDHTSVYRDQLVGTVTYMSPEAIQDTCQGTQVDENGVTKPHIKLGVKSDVWSLGCILYNMVYGKTPFQSIPNIWGRFQAIMNPQHIIKFPEIEDKALIDVMKKCLIRDPKERASIEDLLVHPYLKNPEGKVTEVSEPVLAAPGMQHLVSQLSQVNVNSPRSMSALLEGLLHQVKSGQEMNVKSALTRRAQIQAMGTKPPIPAELNAKANGEKSKCPKDIHGKDGRHPSGKQGQRAPLQLLNSHDVHNPH